MSANGISHLASKAARAAAKLALADTKRSTLPATISDNGIVWTQQIYEPESLIIPKSVTYWAASTVVAINTYINVAGIYYKCTTAGTTGAVAPTWTHSFGYRPLNVLNTSLHSPSLGRPWGL